jgi:flagellar hook-associated protein FlgK
MQRAIEVTGHNVSNVETPGYSRQKALLVAGDPYSVPAANRNQNLGQIGTGVTVEKVQRYRSDFLDSQIRNETLSLKGWEVRRDTLQQIEVAFNEPSEVGINHALGEFWTAWSNLSTTPDSVAARTHVAETTNSLSTAMRETYRQLSNLQGELDDRVGMQVQQVNDLAHRIADLNGTIRKVEGLGQQPNDLRDERGKLLTELAGVIDIDTFETESGSMTVNLGGKWLISDASVSELATQPDPTNSQASSGLMLKQVTWADTGATVQVNGITLASGLSSQATERLGGELGGTLISRDLILSGKMGQLDQMADALIGAVNGLHQSGFGLNGTAGGNLTGASSIPGTVNSFSQVAPWAGQSGLANGTYSLEIRDNSNVLEFRLVNATGQALIIDDASVGGTTTNNWQRFDLVAGTNFDTGRGLAINFGALADHNLGSINTNANVSGFNLSGVAQGATELSSDTYYVEARDNNGISEFRLVDSGGNPAQIYDSVAANGSVTSAWQAIPPGAPSSFDTNRGFTIQFSGGPYVAAVRGGSITPPPIPAASGAYTARGTQLGTRNSGAATVSINNFFSGTGARDIALSDYIAADYNRIATAATANSPGDGSIALKIGQLQSAMLLKSGTASIGNFYRVTVAGLGQEAQQAGIMVNNHELLTQHLQTRQEEVAGVSLDEEMVSLTAYQRTYQAAARVMTTVDEMLDKVINGMGTVGR